jgi:hypothetical protein
MWSALASLILGLAKWVFQLKAKKKLNDKQFLEHIEAHQLRRRGAGKTALDFEDAMAEAESKLGKEE